MCTVKLCQSHQANDTPAVLVEDVPSIQVLSVKFYPCLSVDRFRKYRPGHWHVLPYVVPLEVTYLPPHVPFPLPGASVKVGSGCDVYTESITATFTLNPGFSVLCITDMVCRIYANAMVLMHFLLAPHSVGRSQSLLDCRRTAILR